MGGFLLVLEAACVFALVSGLGCLTIIPHAKTTDEDVTENETALEATSGDMSEIDIQPESEYSDLAIADVTNYVNVRTGPNTDSDIVGKIYDGAVAQILSVTEGEDGEWFHVASGNVEGYIKAEFFCMAMRL